MHLIEYIGQYINFNPSIDYLPELKENIQKGVKTATYKKGTYLIREGEICRKIFFVEKGCLRFFYSDETGKDITH